MCMSELLGLHEGPSRPSEGLGVGVMGWLESVHHPRVFIVDTEFRTTPGNPVEPVCLVAHERRSDHWVRAWAHELTAEPPFPLDDSSLFVCYSAGAELSFFRAMGWGLPSQLVDAFIEFYALTNGLADFEKRKGQKMSGRGELDALAYFNLECMDPQAKKDNQKLVQRGDWSEEEKTQILTYCEEDVRGLDRLLDRMMPEVLGVVG